jgi:23S rRNA pseudouridine1911/1915/1917 synthase
VTTRDDEPQIYVVEDEAAGERLDRWLAARDGAPTRSQIAAAITEGLVKVDGLAGKAGQRLRGGETVILHPRSAVSGFETSAEDIPLDILYCDDHVVAINKAPGMVVHPAVGNRRGTLVNALLHAFPESALPGATDRPGIIHRLDRDTSGVILVARSMAALEGIARQFRDRSVEKEYLALVHGNVKAAGVVDAPIGRHPKDRKRMSVSSARSRAAVSAYVPLERFGDITLLSVKPRTGRTHQIRVHLAAMGWPIVADPIYGRRGRAADLGNRALDGGPLMPRLALHAWRIGFCHPKSGERLLVTADLPPDLQRALTVLGSKSFG